MKTIKLPTGVFEYDPMQPLGKPGGFGQVFAGKTANGQDVAIKKLYLSSADTAHRELKIAEELKNRIFENVIAFIDAGEDADTGDYFVVMPKAEGSLEMAINENGILNGEATSAVMLQIVMGLLEVGELVHRDLKPDNVLFHGDKWKVADFGIARFIEDATASRTLKDFLSPFYAAPEQWRFERATHATDVYALGCIGFFLLTGKPPFEANPAKEHQESPAPKFVCPDSRLATLINMCLRKLPATRPTLSRVKDLLKKIVECPQTAEIDSPLSTLANAAAHVAEIEQQVQAQRLAKEADTRARSELATHSSEILSDNLERLWGKIHDQAPNAKRIPLKGEYGLECQLGDCHLSVKLTSSVLQYYYHYKNSNWDIINGAEISVKQNKPDYIWSSSLWYVKISETSEYRWNEVSYWDWNKSRYQPYACIHAEDVDLAASKISHSVNIAFGPIEIDDEMEEEFHNRWICLLAKATNGQLK